LGLSLAPYLAQSPTIVQALPPLNLPVIKSRTPTPPQYLGGGYLFQAQTNDQSGVNRAY